MSSSFVPRGWLSLSHGRRCSLGLVDRRRLLPLAAAVKVGLEIEVDEEERDDHAVAEVGDGERLGEGAVRRHYVHGRVDHHRKELDLRMINRNEI